MNTHPPMPLVDLTGLDLDTLAGAAQARLRATTDDGLLTTFAALTHRIHDAAQVKRGGVVTVRQITDAQNGDSLRTQRDMVRAEILRRMAR